MRRKAELKQGDEQDVAQLLPDNPMAQKAPPRRCYRDRQDREAPVTTQPAEEVNIFKDRQAAKAPHSPKYLPADKEGLVPKMKEPPGEPCEPTVEAQHWMGCIEFELKATTGDFRFPQCSANVTLKSGGHPGIGVQEEEHIGRQTLRSAVELSSTVWLSVRFDREESARYFHGAIGGAAINNNYGKLLRQHAESFQCAFENRRLIKHRDNNPERELWRPRGRPRLAGREAAGRRRS